MIIPVYKNIEFLNEYIIERCLPNKGKLLVKEGEDILSYTKLGYSKNSSKEMLIPNTFRLLNKIKNKKFITSGEVLAKKDNNYIFAPFDGLLEDREGIKVLIKHQEDFWLLSGVAGKILKIIPSRSCLIKTSGYKIKFFETSVNSVEGELRVLPNPSELIELDFMNRYIKNGMGQVVYTGDYLRKSMVDKAIEVGCEGIICGSCDRETLLYAKQNNFFVGILSGFGRIPTHTKVFEVLKNLESKYILVQENSKEIFVASENILKSKTSLILTPFTFIKTGQSVICLEYPYFGWEGEVIKIESNTVSVKIKKNNEELNLSPFDLIALA